MNDTIRKITDNATINYGIEDIEAEILNRYGINTDEKFRYALEAVLTKVYHDGFLYASLVEVD